MFASGTRPRPALAFKPGPLAGAYLAQYKLRIVVALS